MGKTVRDAQLSVGPECALGLTPFSCLFDYCLPALGEEEMAPNLPAKGSETGTAGPEEHICPRSCLPHTQPLQLLL